MTVQSPPREVVAIGDQPLIAGFALVGVRLYPASSAAEVRAAWQTASRTAAVVILTHRAADAVGDDQAAPQAPLTVVMPA
jgi:vacuolar-type H+-ATPase subunit F/Vma7